MDLAELARTWDRFGADDPLWAVLTHPGKRHGGWDRAEFFASGRDELGRVIARVQSAAGRHGLQVRYGAALDFGCGVGRLSQALCARFSRVDGVDIAPSMLRLARKWNAFGDRCRYHLNTGGDLRLFPDATFDFAYTAHVLQHMQPRFARRYVEEIIRVLAPGGVAVLEITTTPVEGATAALPPEAFTADVRIRECPLAIPAGGPATVAARVTNRSRHAWPAAGRDGWFQVQAGNHWTRRGERVVLDDARAGLPHDLPPAASADLVLEVRAPAEPGRYRLEVDLVQEGVTWFADRGSPVGWREVVVRRPRRARSQAAPAPAGEQGRMEMYGTAEEDFAAWVTGAGGRILDVVDWDEITRSRSTDWHRRGFVVAC